jgi:hypothetical protein
MTWEIKERKLGRAGDPKQRATRQREWDRKYGVDNWEIGYVLDDEFVRQDAAFQSVYCASYAAHFERHPEDLQELIGLAKKLRNPHAEATKGVDLQIPAIMQYLNGKGLQLLGSELVDIGSWQNQHSHKISIRLSPLHIKVVGDDRMTLEQFWQERKVLAVWEEG